MTTKQFLWKLGGLILDTEFLDIPEVGKLAISYLLITTYEDIKFLLTGEEDTTE